MTRVVVRPIGSPTALGLIGLAGGTSVLSGLQLGWVPARESAQVALILMAFPFLLQLVSAIYAFLARDGVAATAFGQLAAVWLSIGLVLRDSVPGSSSDALGLVLLLVAVTLALTASATWTAKRVPALVFAVASIRFGLGGLHQLTGKEGWENAAGVIGLGLAALAVYAAWAAELEEALGKTVLPLGRRGEGKSATEGGLLEQVKEAPTDAGVRQQL